MTRLLSLLAFGLTATALPAADWMPAKTPLTTRWGKAVTPENAWREYPRPQMVRKEWKNLNGLWDYAVAPKSAEMPKGYDGKILVPYCIESSLSGVGKRVTPDQSLWYKREITIPPSWAGKRILLHFGAVDWESTISVNGKELLNHKGGNVPFSVDITDALKKDGTGELVVRVWDPTDTMSQPRGKQVLKPGGIWYTPVTGIWQTVWLEAVPAAHLTQVVFTPDIDAGEVECRATAAGKAGKVTVADAKTGAVLGSGPSNAPFTFKFATDKLWTPDTPTLNEVTVTLDSGDAASSYFAMRKISVGPDDKGVTRMLLNNKFVFQYGPLDQGWWPDGLLTPPSDAALKYDVEYLKSIGCNMLRKHIKVEPARFYRHCDELGLLVWQDMPSGFVERKQGVSPGGKTDAPFTAADAGQFHGELRDMIDHLRGFPCIVVWVPYNEGWGQHDTNAVLKWTQAYDPSRLVNGPSGWQDRGVGDMIDAHVYPGPGMPPAAKGRARVLGEFGGLGLPVDGHTWQGKDNWGYRTFETKDALSAAYHQLMRRLHPLVGKGLSAAVYTQTTDVEVEVNGYLTYDREVQKIDTAKLKEWHDALHGPPPVTTDLVPTSEEKPQTWGYRFDKPADGWQKSATDGDGWKSGPGGFGTKITPNATIATEWDTPDIWVRREFTLKAAPGEDVLLRMYHDEDAEVYLNGVLAAKAAKYNGGYEEFAIKPEALKTLKAGKNVIAIHCKQTGGGQYIDAGLVEVRPAASK
jgi:hypothetical protein